MHFSTVAVARQSSSRFSRPMQKDHFAMTDENPVRMDARRGLVGAGKH